VQGKFQSARGIMIISVFQLPFDRLLGVNSAPGSSVVLDRLAINLSDVTNLSSITSEQEGRMRS